MASDRLDDKQQRPAVSGGFKTQLREIAGLREQVRQLARSGHDLISTQTRMQSLLHNASDAIIQFEADATISSFNSAAERIFDRAEIEVLHQRGEGLLAMPAAFDGNIPRYLSHYVRSVESQYDQPLIGLRRNGERRLLQVSVAEIAANHLVLFDDFAEADNRQSTDGGFEVFLCILRDITERKAVEAELRAHREHLEELVEEQTREIRAAKELAEQASEAKSAFLANMSHELRTPMHAILSYSEVGLKRYATAEPEKIEQYFERIHSAGSRLLGMINDLLDLAKAEAGHMTYDLRPQALQQVIEPILREFEVLAQKRRLTLVYRPGDALGMAEFDGERIGQVIRNYLSNAFKFTPEGSCVTLATAAGRYRFGERELEGIEVTVRDQGEGIPEQECESVFGKFVQSGANRKGVGGTGLGLAICREIVQAHGGLVSAANHPEGGAVFRFAIPRRPNAPTDDVSDLA